MFLAFEDIQLYFYSFFGEQMEFINEDAQIFFMELYAE